MATLATIVPRSHPSSTSHHHPRGLRVLFGTEMWERLSYYGMRSILMLYMVTPFMNGGLGFETARAGKIYGMYTSSVYLTPLIGGWLADRFLGARRAVLCGGIVIASGHFCMAYPSLTTFFVGLTLIALGTGLLKPNISSMVGSLYAQGDPRRDAGFSIFYMGINLGAFLAPFVCGTLAQAPFFRDWLTGRGWDPNLAWHWGFAAAGVGMVFGLVQYVWQQRHIAHVGNCLATVKTLEVKPEKIVLDREEVQRIAVVGILFFFSATFWMIFEQAGSSMTLFANQLTRNTLFGLPFPSSWFLSLNPVFIMLLAPVFSIWWLRRGDRQPSSPAKFAYGLFYVGLGFVVLTWASTYTQTGTVSPLWLTAVYLLHTIGELYLSPVGLSVVTKLAPARMVGLMMGVWFLSISVGNYLAGWLAQFFTTDSADLVNFFGTMAAFTLCAAALLALLVRPIRKLMCGVQ